MKRQELIELGECFGMKFEYVPYWKEILSIGRDRWWDGETLWMYRNIRTDVIAHEIGHQIECLRNHPEDVDKPNWGLGKPLITGAKSQWHIDAEEEAGNIGDMIYYADADKINWDNV